MSETETVSDVDQCVALTSSGERCTRPADEDGFCFQHSENAPTIEDAEDADSIEAALEERGELPNGGADEEATETPDFEGELDLPTIRDTVQSTADDIIGRPLDGIVSIRQTDDDGWAVRVDCLERKAIPDTQDILGQYEIQFTTDGDVREYSRRHRYRRGDTVDEPAGGVIQNNG